MRKRWIQGSAIVALSSTCLLADTPARVQTFPLRETGPMRVEGRSDGTWVAQRKE